MTDEQGYQGWTNYPTWAVALWINNDQGWQERIHELMHELVSDDPDPEQEAAHMRYRAGQIIREDVGYALDPDPDGPATVSGLDADLLGYAVDLVDWTELGASFLRDLAEQDES